MTAIPSPTALAWSTMPAPAPIGALTIGATDVGVAYIAFGDGLRRLTAAAHRVGAELVPDRGPTGSVARELVDYLCGRRSTFTVPIDWSLTSGVQRTVLTTLYDTVGYGATITYGDLAARSDAFGADAAMTGARGVGSIMGSNPIPVIVPCHRVVAADGLGGFGGGLDVKRWLLELEGSMPATLAFDPA